MHKLRFVIILPLIFVVFCLATIYITLIVVLSLGMLKDFAVSHGGRLFGRIVLFLAGVTFEIINENDEPLPPAVFTMNHSSTLDLFLIIGIGLKNIRFVAKKELQYNPFFFIMGHVTGQIFIDRGNTKKAIARLHKTYDFIRKHKFSIMVAPEGSRTHPGIIGPFKKGGIHTAVNLKYPVVPIYVDGAGDLARGSEALNKRGHVKIYIKKPIDTSGWNGKNVGEKTNELRNQYLKWAGVEENDGLSR